MASTADSQWTNYNYDCYLTCYNYDCYLIVITMTGYISHLSWSLGRL